MVPALELLAVLGAALFAGGALYISIVEHPARMKAGVRAALTEFRPSYKRAAPWQATCAALSLVSGVFAAFLASAGLGIRRAVGWRRDPRNAHCDDANQSPTLRHYRYSVRRSCEGAARRMGMASRSSQHSWHSRAPRFSIQGLAAVKTNGFPCADTELIDHRNTRQAAIPLSPVR